MKLTCLTYIHLTILTLKQTLAFKNIVYVNTHSYYIIGDGSLKKLVMSLCNILWSIQAFANQLGTHFFIRTYTNSQ